jgi:translocator protein
MRPAVINMLNSPERLGLWANLALMLAGVIVTNGIIFGLAWDSVGADRPQPWFAPPGFVVGIVWTLLFAAMAVARWSYVRDTLDYGWRSWIIVALAALCLSYPFYTAGLSNPLIGLIGNIGTALAVLVAMGILWPHSRNAALLISPIVAWLTFASFIVVALL